MAEQRVPMTFRDVFFDDPFFKSTWDDFEKARERMMKESRGMWRRFEEEDGNLSGEKLGPRMSRSTEKSSKSSRMESSSRSYESRSNSNTGSSRNKQEEKSSSGRSSRNNNEGASKRFDEGTGQRFDEGISKRFDESTSKIFNEGSNKGFNEGSSRFDKVSSDEISGRDWMVPPTWMFPRNMDDGGWRMTMDDIDSEVISVKETDDKFEVSLDTSKYKPSELQVNVGGGFVSVEGKHEERAEDGTVMVSRQFTRQYSLPDQAKPTNVFSNLSSDGVLVVTAPKDKPAITDGQRNVPIAV